MITLKAPWNERNGRFSPLKARRVRRAVRPGDLDLCQCGDRRCSAQAGHRDDPRTGDWALRLILLSLLVTPLRKSRAMAEADRMCAAWSASPPSPTPSPISASISSTRNSISLHVASEIALRFYLTIGFVALLGLGALAATSTDAMIRRLGAAALEPAAQNRLCASPRSRFSTSTCSRRPTCPSPCMMTGFYLAS